MGRHITIAIATIFQNGGDATRAIEIAKIIREHKPPHCTLEIVFISRGSMYEHRVIEEGFKLYQAYPRLKGVCYQDDFNTKFGELIGDSGLAHEILKGEIEAYKDIKPDLLIYGFWPIGGIARRMAIPNVPSIVFLPLPLTEDFLKEPLTFPEEFYLSRLPKRWQRAIIAKIPHCLKRRNPALQHIHIRKAAEKLGWQGESLSNVFQMLLADLYLINDLPLFYQSDVYDKNVLFTGPVYAQEGTENIADQNLLEVLSADNPRKKLFCTLGTSGSKKELLEIVEMLNSPYGMELSAILLSPPSICPLNEVREKLTNLNVYVTDKFVPAKTINQQVDLVICHGGQGTLQTSITSAVPIIGVATQAEQKINLEHLESYGSAIRVPRYNWNKHILEEKVKAIFNNYDSYKRSAQKLCLEYQRINTAQIISQKVWHIILHHDYNRA